MTFASHLHFSRTVAALLVLCASALAFAPSHPLHRVAGRQGAERLSPLFLSTADFKNGLNIEFENTPWKIMEFLHVKPVRAESIIFLGGAET